MEPQMSCIKGSFQRTFSTRDVQNHGDITVSDAVFIPQIPNCTFHISAQRYRALSDRLVITVSKSNNEQMELTHISMLSKPGCTQCHSGRDSNWASEKVFDFDSRLLKGCSLFTVICDVTRHNPSSNFHVNVKPFLLNPSLSDFTIVIGGEKLSVHKLILGAQSSVFLAMFESDMKESKENKVTIEDIRLEVMKNVLSFLYTGCQEALNDSRMALDMWIVAEKYNIEQLKDLCESKLCGILKESNVLEIFEHAVDHDLKKLQDACLKFIKDNKKKVADEPRFKTSFFEKTELMYKLFYNLLQDKE